MIAYLITGFNKNEKDGTTNVKNDILSAIDSFSLENDEQVMIDNQ